MMSAPSHTIPKAGVGSVIFAGGGTGGHIFPALAICEALSDLPEAGSIRRIAIGAKRSLDEDLLAEAARRGEIDSFLTIPAQPFGVRPKAFIKLIRQWGTCVRETRMLIRDERERTQRDPVIVAMGGYVAAPPVRAAITEGCPIVLVNLDAVPGKANRWIARRADQRFVVGRGSDLFEPMDSIEINPIVRRQIVDVPAQAEARRQLDLDPDRPTLLVTGGSLGARTVNAFMTAFAGAFAEQLSADGWQILHQCGREDKEELIRAYAHAGIPALVAPRIEHMGLAWAAADAAVCRAGAGTVAEVWASQTPALFLPYPFHKDAHQRLNAATICDPEAGILGVDRIDPAKNLRDNGPILMAMLSDSALRQRMADMLSDYGPADGAQRIARSVATLLG